MVRSTPQTGTQGYVRLQHQDVQPSQRTPDCDPSPVDYHPSVFTLDAPRLQRLPDDLDQTTQTAGQQEDEEQVLEGDYEVFREVVRSSLAPFRSSADYADDLVQEIESLIPIDDVHKDKVTWELQPFWKLHSGTVPRLLREWITLMTLLWSTFITELQV